MKASQLRIFYPMANVAASVLLGNGKDFLEVDEHGMLDVPENVKPQGFHLVTMVRENDRAFVSQKNVGKEGGGYHKEALSELEDFAPGFKATVMRDPIEVVRAGKSVWTSWHQQKPNRVDCWQLSKSGKLGLFQVGVFTHDDGKTWKLHGEYRWRGQLFSQGAKIVGIPEHTKWGSLEGGSANRTQIFQHPEFKDLLKDVKLKETKAFDVDINPPLPKVSEPNQATVQWYIVFAGQTGQGPANLHNGSNAWIHGADIVDVNPDPDGEVRLWQGDIVSYTGTEKFGTKPNGPPKLLGVKLVKRSW